jgi:hypothetical protein
MLHGVVLYKQRINFLPHPATGVLDLGVHLAIFSFQLEVNEDDAY